MPTNPTPVSALPSPPDPNNRATFNTLAYPWSVALGPYATQMNALGTVTFNNATEAAASATAALASQNAAATSVTNAAAQVTLATNQANAAAASAATALNSANTTATSTTSVAIGVGAKSFTVQAGKSFAVGQQVIAASVANPANYMSGQVTSYDSGTGALSINVAAIGNGGTFADWSIALSVVPGTASSSNFTYANRGGLRSVAGPSGQVAYVEGLGVFSWIAGSTEPDDDETCFAATGGRWELAAADPDYVYASTLPEIDALAYKLENVSAILRGSFNMTSTGLATGATVSFTCIINGAAVNDSVIVNPSSTTQFNVVSAWVSSANTVTIALHNPSAGSSTTTAGTWQVLVIK